MGNLAKPSIQFGTAGGRILVRLRLIWGKARGGDLTGFGENEVVGIACGGGVAENVDLAILDI